MTDLNTCTTIWPIDTREAHLQTIMYVCIIAAVIMVLLNGLLIMAIHKVQRVKSATDKLMICMCVSDICCGGIVLPTIAAMLHTQAARHNCRLQSAAQYLAFSFGYASFFLVITIALDRYLHLTKLTRYNLFMTEFRLRAIIVTILVTSNALALVSLFVHSFYTQLAMNIANCVGISSIFTLYYSVLRKILLHSKALAQSGRDNRKEANGLETSVIDRQANERSKGDDLSNETTKPPSYRANSETAKPSNTNNASITEASAADTAPAANGTTNSPNKRQRTQAILKSNKSHLAKNKMDEAVVRTILVLLSTIFLLYVPYNILSTIFFFYRFNKQIDPGEVINVLTLWSYIFLFFNGIANVIVLANGNSRIRTYFKRKLGFNKNRVSIESRSEITPVNPRAA